MSTDEGYFKFSARILDHLGISAYNSVQKCVSELLANAYDADATEVKVSIPDTNDENAVIEITDTGTGMDGDELKHKFLFLGRNRRSDGEKTKLGRLVIGSKGIGKLAGFDIASKIHLVTWKSGLQWSMTLDRDAFSDIESLSNTAYLSCTA